MLEEIPTRFLKLNIKNGRNFLPTMTTVLPIFNFSNEELTVTLDSKYFQGNYTELFSKEKIQVKEKYTVSLKPWDYKVLVKD